MRAGDKVTNCGYEGTIISTKFDPIYLVDFRNLKIGRRALRIHKDELTNKEVIGRLQ